VQDPALPTDRSPLLGVTRPHVGGPFRIRVVAPAGPVPPKDLDAGLAVLAARGFEILEGAHTRERLGYLAGEDSDRGADLQEALDDPGCDAVWFARGGYGTTRLLPSLRPPAHGGERLLCGYSDATALHLWASRLSGLRCLYAPSVTELGRPGVCAPASLWAALAGQPEPIPGVGPKESAGPFPVTGGCLSLCVCAVGTPWAPPTRGRWIFLEDVGEKLYRLDRMLTHLAQAGWFAGAGGVLLGSFTGLGAGESAGDVAARVTQLAPGLPVVSGLPVGHTVGKHTLPLGVPAIWDGHRLSFAP